MNAASGRFIVLEGIDGCGSTTQCARLIAALRARGADAVGTCEPSRGPIGALIRTALEKRLPETLAGERRSFRWSTLALLFSADRLDHLDAEVLPAVRAGRVVVSDRYDLSSLAYQSATATEGSDVLEWIRALNREARRPDLTVVLDIPAADAEARRHARGGPEELFETRSLQARLAELYARAELLVPGDRIAHVSALGEADAVTERILAEVLGACPEL